VLVSSLPGCGGGDTKFIPVEGKVMLDGKQLTLDSHIQGSVTLHPDKSKGNNSLELPTGTIDAEGKYKIMVRNTPGAPPGWYKVTVSIAPVVDPKNPYLKKTGWLMHERHRKEETSKLAFEVVANPAPGAYDLQLDKPDAK
jgi:hypothetical protein